MPDGPLHKNQTGANLHVPGYQQSSDPGAVGEGKFWVDTTGGTGAWVLKSRNAADSGWETLASGSSGSHVVVDRVYSEYTSNTNLTTTIPGDDTIPQNTEGTEVLTATITPKDSTNRIRIRFQCCMDSTATVYLAAALFVDSTANALCTVLTANHASTGVHNLVLEYEESAGSTSARTYKIRVGGSSGTIRLNGNVSGRLYGGTMRATLIVEEIDPV